MAKRLEGREDDAARKLGELARTFDPSEIYANELEDTQLLCQTLEGCRAAMECMRDHAAEIYRVETGQPFSTVKGSRVSTKLSASMIDARDYLASRARTRREQFAPEGPVVAFSGGQEWHDHELLWDRLDQIAKRIPEMVLATTAQAKGCDAIATAWAASRGIKVVQFKLDRSQGNRAAFVRNDRIVNLKPVEAIVCEGSGIQSNFAQKLRAAGVPADIGQSVRSVEADVGPPDVKPGFRWCESARRDKFWCGEFRFDKRICDHPRQHPLGRMIAHLPWILCGHLLAAWMIANSAGEHVA